MKKTIYTVLLAFLIGIFLSSAMVKEYKNSKVSAITNNKKEVYLYQFGAYKTKKNMEEACKKLENYYYYYDNKLYYSLIGISFSKDLKEKLKKAYNIDNDLYVKKIIINNNEFINNLKQYDKLILNTNDNKTIINSQKQILQKYDELIINEQNPNK